MKTHLIRAAIFLALPLAVYGVMHSQQTKSPASPLAGAEQTKSQASPLATTQQTQRFPQFENESVKVWKSVILPNQPLAMHHHDHPRVIIALTGGVMNLVEQNGPTERHVWETGKAYWLPAMPAGAMHADVNAGDKPIEVMVVELEKEK